MRHGEHQDLNVKQKGYSRSHFLGSREFQCVERSVVAKDNCIFFIWENDHNLESSCWLIKTSLKTEKERKIEKKIVCTCVCARQKAGKGFSSS